MTAYIHGQGDGQPQLATEKFQIAINFVGRINVLFAFIHRAVQLDDWQQIGRMCGVVFVQDILHTLFPPDKELLPGLAPAV